MKTTNAYIIKTTNANFKCVTTNMYEYKKNAKSLKTTNISLLLKSFVNVYSNYKRKYR